MIPLSQCEVCVIISSRETEAYQLLSQREKVMEQSQDVMLLPLL